MPGMLHPAKAAVARKRRGAAHACRVPLRHMPPEAVLFFSLALSAPCQASSEATSSRACCTADWAGRAEVACVPEWVLAFW